MTSQKEDHLERTAKEPREPTLHKVIITGVDEVGRSIRVFRLEIPDRGTIEFLPGQWLDVFTPASPKPGGFTITSAPSSASPSSDNNGYLELAIQTSPSNPPATYLWQPISSVVNTALHVRVGGSFVWPPANVSPICRVIFVAGGVGINPLISMLSALAESQSAPEVYVLYSMKMPPPPVSVNNMLFVERIVGLFERKESPLKGEFKLFLPGGDQDDGGRHSIPCNDVDVPFETRRISEHDVELALGQQKQDTVVYICGVPEMTDHFVEVLISPDGLALEPRRVLFEKWW